MIKKISVLIFGLYLFGLGMTLIAFCGLGMDPWNLFHDGIGNLLSINLGYATILVSILFIVISMYLGESLGIGTILNGVLVGMFVQLHIDLKLLTMQDSFIKGILYLLLGMIFIGLGSYFYLKQGMGAGPRDSLCLAISKRTKKKMGHVKTILEIIAVIVGIFLRGDFGIATILAAIFTGIIVQIIFDLLNFDVNNVYQSSFKETIKEIVSTNKKNR